MKIVLAYKRREELVNDAHLFDGYILENQSETRLNGKTFAELIFTLSEVVRAQRQKSQVGVFMVRLEQPSVEHAVSDDAVETICVHPHKYIEALSPPPQRIVLKVNHRAPTSATATVGLRAGVETLIDAFGESVYVQVKNGEAECPRCGRWRGTMWRRGGSTAVKCVECGFLVVAHAQFRIDGHSDWAAIFTEDLLGVDAQDTPRFFLPRAWNTSGPWITREDLQKKYDKYVEEKENADR